MPGNGLATTPVFSTTWSGTPGNGVTLSFSFLEEPGDLFNPRIEICGTIFVVRADVGADVGADEGEGGGGGGEDGVDAALVSASFLSSQLDVLVSAAFVVSSGTSGDGAEAVVLGVDFRSSYWSGLSY